MSPSEMTAGQINKALDKIDDEISRINEEMIDAGRGDERASKTWKKSDPLAMKWRAASEKRTALRNEAERRYGPGAPRHLPRGFGPLKGYSGMKKKTETFVLPAFLASALINGDVSGLEESDNKWLEAALKLAEPGHYVDVGEEYFAHRCDLPGFNMGADVAEFTVLYP